MKLYKKPIITVDSGMAEGIYAASGSKSNAFSVKRADIVANWGGPGQRNFSLDLTSLKDKNIKLCITFNMSISSGWGNGFSSSVEGSMLTLTCYSSPDVATITVQTSNDVTTLDVASYTVLSAYDN